MDFKKLTDNLLEKLDLKLDTAKYVFLQNTLEQVYVQGELKAITEQLNKSSKILDATHKIPV